MDRQELNRLYSNYEAAIRTLRETQALAVETYVKTLHDELERLNLMADMHQKVAAKKNQDAVATVCHWKNKCQEAEAALQSLKDSKPWWKFW